MTVPRGMSTTSEATDERRESVRKLSLSRLYAREIASEVGISIRTVQRYRGELIRAGRLRLASGNGDNRVTWKAGR